VTSSQRSLRSYLLLPRPRDAFKWGIFPATFGLGLLGGDWPSEDRLVRAAVAWAVLEVLVYQARYQWNDIRGFAADQAHPEAGSRGRLPGPLSRGRAHIRASAAVASLRLGVGAAIVLAWPGLHLAATMAVLAAAVFAVAGLYEYLRGRSTGHSTGVSASLPPGVLAIWVAVGGGYAVRGAGGVALALELGHRPELLATSILAMWSFGVSFVTARWTIEALAFARREGTALTWTAVSSDAREHLLALTRWLPPGPPPHRKTVEWPALRSRTAARAPWNLAGVSAGAWAAATGRLLSGPASVGQVSLAAGLAGLLAWALLRRPRHGNLMAGAGAIVLMACASATGSPRPWLTALTWLTMMMVLMFFSAQSLSTLHHPLRGRLRRVAVVVGRFGARGRAPESWRRASELAHSEDARWPA
jgi:hypothetical protein